MLNFLMTAILYYCVSTLTNDLLKIQDWSNQRKMLFNPDQTKQAQEVVFSRKTNIIRRPSLYFNNTRIEQTPFQKQ